MTTRASKSAIVFAALVVTTIAAPVSGSHANSAMTSPSAFTGTTTESVQQQAITNGAGDVATFEDGRFFAHKPTSHLDIDDIGRDRGW